MKAHLAGLARVLAKAKEISLRWAFPWSWGFPRENIFCIMCLMSMLVAGYLYYSYP